MTDTEMIQAIYQDMQELKKQVSSLDEKLTTETTKIKISLENDISKKIDIIGEGHDFLKQRLDDALQMEKKRENMELELVNLRMEIKKIKEHLNIA